MRRSNLTDMVGGWFVGNFDPSVLKTADFEVGIKRYKAGSVDALHYHKVATEITVIISGRATMGDCEYGEGDIIVIEPGDATQFSALSDVVIAVVKTPSLAGDKYSV